MGVNHVPAYMNHGRWIADCPGPCSGGAVAMPGLECDECHVLGYYTMVIPILPTNVDEIETAMSIRPEARTRNWTAESVDALHAETRDYLYPKDADGEPIDAGLVADAAKAVAAKTPQDQYGRLNLRADHIPDAEQLGTIGAPREPIRYRGRKLWVPPNLPEGWSEGGKPANKPGGDS